MFGIGDFIVYGRNGVCVVEKIGKIDSGCTRSDREYYTLRPYYNNASTIFTPVNNEKVLMRPVCTKTEALELIGHMKEIDALGVKDEKRRENEYKEAIGTCDCISWVKIIKSIYLRQESRTADGKKMTAVDERYFRTAEDNLYGELAVSLGMSKEETKEFVMEKLSA
ncbi:MAG: CarD family transcriptional regulator [Lachnospiraceae bacterium]|nr:CarD family transcriptional regulator [Lachnospiraceae bacterium]